MLFRGVTTPPQAFNAWLEATVLRVSIVRVLWLAGGSEGGAGAAWEAGSQEVRRGETGRGGAAWRGRLDEGCSRQPGAYPGPPFHVACCIPTRPRSCGRAAAVPPPGC